MRMVRRGVLVALFVAALFVCPALSFNMKAFKEEFGRGLKGSTGTRTRERSESHQGRKKSDVLMDESGNVVTGTPLDTPIPEALGGNNGMSIYTGFQVLGKFANRLNHLVFGSELKDFEGVDVVRSPKTGETFSEKASNGARARRGSSTEIVTGCEPGRMVSEVSTVDTCKNGRQCYAHKISCSSDIKINMETTTAKQLLDYGDKCNITQALCGGIVVDFKDQFSLEKCTVQEIYCTRAVPINKCSLRIVCPDQTTYGENGFGRPDIKVNELVCNRKVVEDPLTYNEKELPSYCEVRNSTCDTTKSTCYSMSCTGSPCMLSVVSTAKLCSRIMNTTSCVCPADRKGSTCDEYEPIVWSSKITIPKKRANKEESKDAKLTYDRSLFSVTVEPGKNLSLYIRVNCTFENTLIPKNPGNFSYWINTEDLLVYEDPSWVLQAKIFNFKSISSTGRMYRETLTSQNILGKESVIFTIPTQDLTSEYVYGGRAYMEIGFGDDNYPPGFKNIQLQRIFFDVKI